MSLTNLSLNRTLLLLLGSFSFVFLAFAMVSWRTIETVRVNGPLYAAIVEGKDLVADILPPPAYIIESHLLTLQLIDETEPSRRTALIERGSALRIEFEKRHEFWTRTLAAGALADAMNVVAYRPAAEYYRIRDNELVPAVLAGDRRGIEAALVTLKQRYEEHRRAVDEVVKLTNARNHELEQRAELALAESRRNLLLLGALVIMVVVLLAWITRRTTQSLAARLSLAGDVVSKVAEGDLTVRVPDAASTDESGRLVSAIRAMTTSLNSLVARVRQASLGLSVSADDFAQSGRKQENSVSGLRDSAVRIAGAARGISDTSTQLLDTMEGVNLVAGQTAQVAAGGRSSLNELTSAMEKLQQATGSISMRLGTIREKASDISSVVTTITKIADQTNLLSINAAIEAEKAGDQGLGFLVLAREIRRLADQTAVATLDIEQMVRHMQSAVSAGVMEMDGFAAQVKRGAGVTTEVGTQLGQILQQVQSLSQRFDDVNGGMRSQSLGARQISEAMAELMAVAQSSADTLPEFNAAISRLRQAAHSLSEEISRFKLEA